MLLSLLGNTHDLARIGLINVGIKHVLSGLEINGRLESALSIHEVSVGQFESLLTIAALGRDDNSSSLNQMRNRTLRMSPNLIESVVFAGIRDDGILVKARSCAAATCCASG